MNKFAGIIVNNEAVQLDMIFTYMIPKSLQDKDLIGAAVKIPFGKSNKLIDGYVIETYEQFNDVKNIKEIAKCNDSYPTLRHTDILLINFMHEKYLCTYLDCIRSLLPSGVGKDITYKYCDFVITGIELNGKYELTKYEEIYNTVNDNNGVFTKSELVNKFKFSPSSINTLVKHGFLNFDRRVVGRFDNRRFQQYEKKTLNSEQLNVFNGILSSENKKFLIHGVTGSGKTEVYMHLVEEMLNRELDTIILVPEISLTPQMIERFKGRFGSDIAVFHSRLSEGEKIDEWTRVRKGDVKVAVGARSAVFLPFKSLGMIIIDEEHELSYKSDANPKYDAREIAEFRCELDGCKVVLASATPSIETFYRVKSDDKEIFQMNNRADCATMPKSSTIDMREELLSNNKSIFSRKLYYAIKQTIENKEQVILFLNKRGFSSFISCRKCGYVFKCSSCDISMTYHAYGEYLECHYCGKKQKATRTCPSCGSNYVKHFGVGTERVEEEIKKYFPEAKTIRMDFDTTRKKNSYENIYNSFKNKEADILIGTQMIAKGLDFENVTLVGVLAADLSLNMPDYRAAERTFQLLTQVSGRAGRGKKAGEVIIQSYSPDNFSIQKALVYDYEGFYNEEIKIRQDMNYPPFSKILLINLSSKNEEILIKTVQNIGSFLKDTYGKDVMFEILGPCPSSISKMKDSYRWQIIFKGEITNKLAAEVKFIIYKLVKNVYNDIRVSIDINPSSLL